MYVCMYVYICVCMHRYPSASFSTDILLDEVSCFSFDTTLLECSHNAIGVHDCSHSEDVELVCSTTSTSSSEY